MSSYALDIILTHPKKKILPLKCECSKWWNDLCPKKGSRKPLKPHIKHTTIANSDSLPFIFTYFIHISYAILLFFIYDENCISSVIRINYSHGVYQLNKQMYHGGTMLLCMCLPRTFPLPHTFRILFRIHFYHKYIYCIHMFIDVLSVINISDLLLFCHIQQSLLIVFVPPLLFYLLHVNDRVTQGGK